MAGWAEGVQLMVVGETGRLWIHEPFMKPYNLPREAVLGDRATLYPESTARR